MLTFKEIEKSHIKSKNCIILRLLLPFFRFMLFSYEDNLEKIKNVIIIFYKDF